MNDSGKRSLSHFVKDPSFWAIIAGNIFSIVIAVQEQWNIYEILWTYWLQSVIIGVINVYRLATLKEFSVEGVRMNKMPVPESPATRRMMAGFFAAHYGIFHLVYMGFLLQDSGNIDTGAFNTGSVALAVFSFFMAHTYSYKRNHVNDFRDRKPNIGQLMMYPYIRIIPMHIIIIFGSLMEDTTHLIVFMTMKTIADGAMHLAERRLFRKS